MKLFLVVNIIGEFFDTCCFTPLVLVLVLVEGVDSDLLEDKFLLFIVANADGETYNVECNAEEGFITEIEREVSKDDPLFKKLAKISYAEAEETALAFHPGKVVSSEREISFEGDATYEFDIQSIHGYEVKVDVNAATGEIEEANIELYEIGVEKEN